MARRAIDDDPRRPVFREERRSRKTKLRHQRIQLLGQHLVQFREQRDQFRRGRRARDDEDVWTQAIKYTQITERFIPLVDRIFLGLGATAGIVLPTAPRLSGKKRLGNTKRHHERRGGHGKGDRIA